MAQSTNVQKSVVPNRCEPAIAHLLAEAHCDLRWGREIAALFELISVTLGDVITTAQAQQDGENLWIVVEGRVRLRCLSQNHREFSLQVLEEGSTFGIAQHLPYRAVATGEGLVAKADWQELEPWLHQLPALRSFLQQQIQTRDDLIFLRTFVFQAAESVTGYQISELQQQLQAINIAAGTALTHPPQLQTGYCWLRHGIIQRIVQPEHPEVFADTASEPSSSNLQSSQHLQPGDGWGYPESLSQDWVAVTDVVLYQLKPEHWDTLQRINENLLPFLQRGSEPEPTLEQGHDPSEYNYPCEYAITKRINQQRSKRPHLTTAAIEGRATAPADFVMPRPRHRFRLQPWPCYPFIAQQSSADCGPTCLAMVAQYWGHRLNINILRELAQVGRSGANLRSLAVAAEKAGFQGHPVRASLSGLAEQPMPWIAHWQGQHYVVVYRVRGNQVLVADPGRGKRQITRQAFLESWSGYALLLEPSDRLKNSEAKQKASLGKFWRVLWPYRAVLGQIIFLSLLMHVFGLVMPVLNQIILDQVVVQGSMDMLNVLILGALLLSAWSACLGAFRQYLLDYFSNRLNLTLVSAFVHHTLRLPLAFFEQRQVGDIITRVQENRKIQAFLMRQAITTWMDVLMAAIYMGLMFYYNSQLALLVVALLPPIILLTLASTPFLKQFSREVFNESAEQNSLLVEMLTGISTVKVAAAEQEIRWRWEDRLTSLLNTQFKAQKFTNVLGFLSGMINTMGGLALLWYGASLVIQGQLSIGQLVAFNLLIGKVLGPCMTLVGLWDEFQEVLIAVERLNDVLETQPEDHAADSMLVLPPLRGDVNFENVTFSYGESEEHNVLQNISFRAQPGQTIAIVGRSGSGKSTLLKLLQGMYPASRGRILIDDHDVNLVAPGSLRSQLGVVPQECFLFSGTILDNIRLYRDHYPLSNVIEVAKLAEAHSFIQALPLGYNTKVGERGANLSGGQRQRIAIARALLGTPPVLVLDEATSSLDTESEHRFQQNLARLRQGRTTFIIAHRLATVRDADLILVLDRGCLVEQGTHETLLQQKGLYYHLVQKQLDL